MADGKLTYDIDFNVNTEAISTAIARAVDGVVYNRSYGSTYNGSQSYDVVGNAVSAAGTYSVGQNAGYENYLTDVARKAASNRADPFGAAIAQIGLAHNYSRLLPAVQASLGIGTPYFNNLGVSSVTDFAYAATDRQFGYTPATAQTMVNSAVLASLRGHGVKVLDKSYEFETQYNIQSVRAAQNQQRKSDLALTLWSQGDMYRSAAEEATDPMEKRALYRKAASSYRSVSNRTLIESGAVDSGEAMGAISSATEMDALASGAGRKGAEYDLMEKSLASREAQEDAAWAARGKELSYSESQKAREMEAGFRAIEANSATEAIYNPDKDPYAKQAAVNNAIRAAGGYVDMAKSFGQGTYQRRAYLNMASSALGGITPSFMSAIGMNSKQIEGNTLEIARLTDEVKELNGSAPGDGDSNKFWMSVLRPTAVAGLLTTITRTIGSVMEGRTQWLSDTRTPYQTERDVRYGWMQKFGLGAIGAGATAGAIAGSVIPGLGTAVGGVAGALLAALPGIPTYLMGTHYKDEKKIGDQWQSRAIDMLRYQNLYGPGVDYNYSLMAENTGYISQSGMLKLNQTADMLPGAMAFGAVGEQEMMALSMMPNYYAALMEGRSTMELAEAYRKDIMSLPREYRQYITSILPGASEDLRAFVSSDQYATTYTMRGYSTKAMDAAAQQFLPGLEAARYNIAYSNVSDATQNMLNEVPLLSPPNYVHGSEQERLWAQYNAGISGTLIYGAGNRNGMLEAINSVWTGDKAHSKLGDIIIQIDGNTVHQQEYTYEDFMKGAQTYMVGG